ncbi:retrovirus-related pol polyprotein from transposon TNT 1-94 [Tanacetum coccineum]|uniref:Retrovirus-related pol polyprotein from transposon TNT 1-94 n=1 Tax=Tanacetum coccineum TaxID=301880 RepID=A0ABQ4XHN3_9ASTR
MKGLGVTWDEEEVSLDDNEIVEVKLLMALAEANDVISKRQAHKWLNGTPLLPLKKLDGVEPISGPKTIKSILRSKSTFKAETLKDVTINKPSSAPAKGNKSSSALKVNSAPAARIGHLTPEIINHNRIISLRRGIKPGNPQHVMKSYETCGSTFHTTTDHNDIEWFKRGEELQAKKGEALKSSKRDIRKPIWYLDSRCSRHMTGVKSYLHKYMEQPGPKVFDKKRGTIFNSNKEVVMIAPRVRDAYVLDMTSSAQESCFFDKASENLNWLWHKRLAHLNFKTINKLAKQNLVVGLPSLVYSKDRPCSSCEKGKHHRARAGMLTRAMAKELSAALAHECLFVDFLSKEEPKKVSEALKHLGWVDVMQDELNQFARNKVWTLVPAPYGKTIIGSKWVFINKRDETGIVIKNKARLVAQCYNQQEGIDYDETFALIARLEAIRIFLAFSTYMNFIVYQMDAKRSFLNRNA